MAGTVTQAKTKVFRDGKAVGEIITFSWLCTAGGAADLESTDKVVGKLSRVVTDPGAAAPTADYDVTLTDEDGMDVMGGELADRHTTATEQAWASDGTNLHQYVYVDSKLTLNVAAAGNAKNGTVILHVEY